MFFQIPRLTPGYIRYLQTQAMLNMNQKARKDGVMVMPRLAVLLGALGIGMCGYSSKQLALHHRPSARFLQWTSPITDSATSSLAQARVAPSFMELPHRSSGCQDVPPPSFAIQKVNP
ncbi:uncharacterized protein zgc:193593 [Hypomesus transpacificus]|uniref:uncharacterized protein zgc:193593 n=1 Tax=Hypomesus transpacificus TaxID=137520 RepID=UPI001F08154E|nr:uncharacterized protein zgc:193593 [Hypomesus transpacificus]